MISMRSSGAAVFTRNNPFPRDPPLPKSHYSPTRSRKIPKQQKSLALSPVLFTQKPISPEPPSQTLSQKKEDQVFHEGSHSVLLCPPTSSEGPLSFSESWPSTDLSPSAANSPSSPCTESQMYAARNMVATGTGPKEPSVLAKYIERFRFGKPQSREERQREVAQDDDQLFWWKSTSPPSSSTPTQASEKHARESPDLNSGPLSTHKSISKSPVRDMLDLSMLTLSELSRCDPEEPEILQLQEQASRLLQKSARSLSSCSMHISSEGLGCSDFSSPVSADEPIGKPHVPTLIGSSNLVLEPSLCERTSFPTPAVGSGVRREDDILFQWRLRRKMEQARQWCQETSSHSSVLHVPLAHTVGPNQAQHSHLNNTPLQRSHLTFTPVTLASLDPPTPEPAFPISSPSVSRLQPGATIKPQDQHIQPDPLPQKKKHETNLPRHHRQTETQVNIQESSGTKSSSPSPQTSDSTEERWPNTRGKKTTAVKGKIESEGHEKIAPSSRKKKSDGVKKSSSPLRVKQARGHEGVNRKSREVGGKTRWQEEGQRSAQRGRSGDRAPPPSPIQNALGQVVSEVLFSSVDSPTPCKTPYSSVSPAFTPPPPLQTPDAPPPDVQQPFKVIDQLMQDAEDSDGKEFEDDPLLQVLRQQRKFVKEKLCEVDMMLEQFLPLTPPTGT
ncbi:proline and serine-rich protein 3 [Misgurnus anguillicaudatus]|uniref:proline and serine-rich protein 3 n=1 Tax=Misgurnus anguillicaudatus TaxID=75329 RepID=UPI003CCF951C